MPATEAAILNRILRLNAMPLSSETARDVLPIDFDSADQDRMSEFSAKARAGTLTAEEEIKSGKSEVVGHLWNIMQSKLVDPSSSA